MPDMRDVVVCCRYCPSPLTPISLHHLPTPPPTHRTARTPHTTLRPHRPSQGPAPSTRHQKDHHYPCWRPASSPSLVKTGVPRENR